jgi:putative hydrolase of the HAD superfamily
MAGDTEIDAAWCAMLIDFPAEKIEMLQQLQKHYQLYLFSNTNSIHIRYFHRLFRDKFGYSLSDLFVKDYYSSEIQLRKPTQESFQFVLNDADINPSETLFIDDSDQNIAGAELAGMYAIHITPEKSLTDLLK